MITPVCETKIIKCTAVLVKAEHVNERRGETVLVCPSNNSETGNGVVFITMQWTWIFHQFRRRKSLSTLLRAIFPNHAISIEWWYIDLNVWNMRMIQFLWTFLGRTVHHQNFAYFYIERINKLRVRHYRHFFKEISWKRKSLSPLDSII